MVAGELVQVQEGLRGQTGKESVQDFLCVYSYCPVVPLDIPKELYPSGETKKGIKKNYKL